MVNVMNRGTPARLNLPGGTTDQLAFLSLSDGGGSTFVGLNAGNKFPGSLNTFVGAGSGTYSESVSTSVYLGSLAGESSDRAGDTVAIGYSAARYARDSYSNVLVGTGAGESLRRADFNTAVGHRALGSAGTGRRNVAVGALSGLNARQLANSVCIGYSSGAATCGGDNVYVGAFSGREANVYNTTLVGSNTGTVLRGANVVAFGAECAAYASDITDVVIAGYAAGASMANVSTSLALGAGAGQFMSDSAHTVIAGYAAGRTLTNSEYNTIIGSECAANAQSRYTTVVGSNSMNRRDGGMVEFSNCVIVGENITFDLPTQDVTLTYVDIISGYTLGTFVIPSRNFPDPFVQLNVSSVIGTGYLAWQIDETATTPLLDTQREITIFHSLEITQGTWSVAWGAPSPELGVAEGYFLGIAITPFNYIGYIITMTMKVDSQTVATRTMTVPSVDVPLLYMDLEIHQMPQPQGIRVGYSFTLPVDPETGEYNTGANGDFTVTQYAATHPSRSYVRTSATSPAVTSGGLNPGSGINPGAGLNPGSSGETTRASKTVYSLITYTARKESGYVTTTFTTDSPHSVREGSAVIVNATVSELAFVAQSAAADYQLPDGAIVQDITCDFSVPATSGTYTLEWPDSVLTLSVDTDRMTLTIDANSVQVLRATPEDVYAQGSIIGDGLPLRVSRISAEEWMTVHVSRTGVAIEVRGYATGGYRAGAAPENTLAWEFLTPLAAEGTVGGKLTVSGTTGFARGLVFTTTAPRSVPVYANCVFLGSNFTVENDTADALVINLGRDTTILRATSEQCTISSARTRVTGALVVGDSAAENHIEFRGLYQDGYEVNTPSCFIGERVYKANTECSELLLVKGEDPGAPLGPDRIRMLSGEFRVDTFAGGYVRGPFANVANAATTTVMTASADGVYVNTLLYTRQLTETVVSITGASGVVDHNFLDCSIFSHSGFYEDFTCNFIGVPAENGRASTFTLLLRQSATPYMVSGVSVFGTDTPILWYDGTPPEGTAAATDILTFTLLRQDNAWTVFGQGASYK